MSSSVLGISILVGLGCLILVAYIAHCIEKAAEQRRLQVLALQKKIRRGWNLVSELPAAYLPANIRQLLLAYLHGQCQHVLNLDPKHSATQARLASIEELQSHPYDGSSDCAEPVFNSIASAEKTAALITELSKFFVDIHSAGSLDKSSTQHYVDQTKALHSLIQIDIEQLAARHAEATGRYKRALFRYRHCRKRLQSFVDQGQMTARMEFLDQRIETLTNQLETDAEQNAADGEKSLEEP